MASETRAPDDVRAFAKDQLRSRAAGVETVVLARHEDNVTSASEVLDHFAVERVLRGSRAAGGLTRLAVRQPGVPADRTRLCGRTSYARGQRYVLFLRSLGAGERFELSGEYGRNMLPGESADTFTVTPGVSLGLADIEEVVR